jgi:hypothetical protein
METGEETEMVVELLFFTVAVCKSMERRIIENKNRKIRMTGIIFFFPFSMVL